MDDIIKKEIGRCINSALAVKDVRQKDLAAALGVSDNTVSYFVSGSRTPNTEQIIKIAKYLDVSADYLLGLSDVMTTNSDIKMICDYTGLTERSCSFLNENKDETFDTVLNWLLSSENPIIIRLCNYMLSSVFSEAYNKEFPMRRVQESYKAYFSDIIEQLPLCKESFEKTMSNNAELKDRIIKSFLIKSVNIYEAKRALKAFNLWVDLPEPDNEESDVEEQECDLDWERIAEEREITATEIERDKQKIIDYYYELYDLVIEYEEKYAKGGEINANHNRA